MKISIYKILMSATLLMAGQLSAHADGMSADSSYYKQHIISHEVLSSLEPTYLKDAVVGSPWSRNWFVSVGAGTSAFVGTPLGCEDLFGRMQPALQFSVGKWFTPSIGVRASYQGFGLKFIDAAITDHRYHSAHAELLWNVIGGVNTHDELGLHRWTLAPYVGGGIIHHEDIGSVPFTLNYGVLASYRLNRRLSVNMELAGLNTFQDFDGMGKARRFGDQMYTLSAGLTVNIGKVGWKRAVDANPYRQQNEYLMDYVNQLLHDKRSSSGRDSLSFRGRLGKGGSYSGLASLRARLANKDSDGDGSTLQSSSATDTIAGHTSDGRSLIGVPFYIFFRINSCDLTDESQLQNLTNLAKVAKAYNLMVYVEGAADSATGTEDINAALSQARADYIACLLREQGIDSNAIRITAKGGINKFTPVERNRHTRVLIRK